MNFNFVFATINEIAKAVEDGAVVTAITIGNGLRITAGEIYTDAIVTEDFVIYDSQIGLAFVEFMEGE